MIVIELLEAVIKLGLPVFGVSWWAIHSRYKKGDIAPGADNRAVKSNLKEFRKKWRKNKKSEYNLFENKWMRFGGGFYGITALTTFILIELGDLLSFFGNITAIEDLFSNGLIDLAVNILVDQIRNFVTSVIWFTFWADGDRSIFIWVGIPYASYLLAVKSASRFDSKATDLESDDEMENKIESNTNSQ